MPGKNKKSDVHKPGVCNCAICSRGRRAAGCGGGRKGGQATSPPGGCSPPPSRNHFIRRNKRAVKLMSKQLSKGLCPKAEAVGPPKLFPTLKHAGAAGGGAGCGGGWRAALRAAKKAPPSPPGSRPLPALPTGSLLHAAAGGGCACEGVARVVRTDNYRYLSLPAARRERGLWGDDDDDDEP